MPVIGPDYNKEHADRVAQEYWDKIRNENNILNIPKTSKEEIQRCKEKGILFVDTVNEELREEVKQHFFSVVHRMFEVDSWENF